jgi:hypothetical protein
MHSLGVYTDQCLASIRFAHFSHRKKNSARRQSGLFFFILLFSENQIHSGTAYYLPSLFPLFYYHYCRIYLGFQSLSTGRLAFFGFCMKDRSLPGVKGGVCITIAVTGKVVYGMVGLDHALSMLFDGLYKVSLLRSMIGKGYRMKRQGVHCLDCKGSFGVFFFFLIGKDFLGTNFLGGASNNNKIRQIRYLFYTTLIIQYKSGDMPRSTSKNASFRLVNCNSKNIVVNSQGKIKDHSCRSYFCV